MNRRERGLASVAAMKIRGTWLGLRGRKKYVKKKKHVICKPKPIKEIFVREPAYVPVSVRAKYSIDRDNWSANDVIDRLTVQPIDELIEQEESCIYFT